MISLVVLRFDLDELSMRKTLAALSPLPPASNLFGSLPVQEAGSVPIGATQYRTPQPRPRRCSRLNTLNAKRAMAW